MGSVAEAWLADDLAGLKDDPSPRLQADLYRCARETGWTPGRMEWSAQPYVVHHAVNWMPPHGQAGVRMRASVFAPVLGFVRPSPDASWGQEYLDRPALTRWWQEAGWLVPDSGWLNASFELPELARLPPDLDRELRRWPTLSRGDALFFEW